VLCLSSMISTSTLRARPINLEAVRTEGKSHYNAKRYQKAQDSFIRVLQHTSTKANDYLKLAYAAYYNQNYEISAIAYRFYFEFKKIKKPKDPTYLEIIGKVKNQADLKRKRLYRVKVEDILHLIKDGKIFGENHAIEAIQELHKNKVIEPRIQRIYYQLKKALHSQFQKILNQWVSSEYLVSEQGLEKYLDGLQVMKRATWGTQADDQNVLMQRIEGVQALIKFKQDPNLLLKFTQKYNDQNITIKTLQIIALQALKRCEEAYLMSDALSQDHNLASQERLFIMKGILAIECNKIEGIDSLVQVLQHPPSSLEKAAKASFKKKNTP
jgi:hypothetical protein